MNLDSSKNLGGIGAILILIGSIVSTYTFGILDLIGVILVFVALSGLANYYKEKGIFTNAIYSLVAGIVGVVVAAATALYIIFDTTILTGLLQKLYPTWNGSWSTISSIRGMTPVTTNINASDVTSVLGAVFLVLVILVGFRNSCSFIRQTITQNSLIKSKCRLILNRFHSVINRRISNNNFHRRHSNLDRCTVNRNCLLPNKTTARTTHGNNGTASINAYASIKTQQKLHFCYFCLYSKVLISR